MAAQARIQTGEMGALHFRTAWVRRGITKGLQPRPFARARSRMASVRLQDLTPFSIRAYWQVTGWNHRGTAALLLVGVAFVVWLLVKLWTMVAL